MGFTNKRFTKDEALAKIKVLMSQFYENVGREEFEDVDMERLRLLDKIDEILSKTEILSKYLIVEQLKLEEKNQDE